MDYKDTLCLPKTEFPMKAKLAQREPEVLKKWEEEDLYKRILAESADRPNYLLHDGPPYANGHIHMGHALNKILKDNHVRFQEISLQGFWIGRHKDHRNFSE